MLYREKKKIDKIEKEELMKKLNVTEEEFDEVTAGISIDPMCLAKCMIEKFDLVKCTIQCTKF